MKKNLFIILSVFLVTAKAWAIVLPCTVEVRCYGTVANASEYFSNPTPDQLLTTITINIDPSQPAPRLEDLRLAHLNEFNQLEKDCNRIRYQNTQLPSYPPPSNPSFLQNSWQMDMRHMWITPWVNCPRAQVVDRVPLPAPSVSPSPSPSPSSSSSPNPSPTTTWSGNSNGGG